MDRLLAKNPPAEDIDFSLATALTNSKLTLLPVLLAGKPENSPKTSEVVKELLAGPYHGDDDFEKSIQLTLVPVVKLFLDQGKHVSPYQFRLALKTWEQELLTLMIDSEKLNLINALGDSIDFGNIECIRLLKDKIKNDPSVKIPSSMYQRGIKSNNMEIINILRSTVPCDGESPSVMTPQEVDALFALENNKAIIEKMILSGFDLGNALYSAVKMAKEPSQSYIRAAWGDYSPVDYYWYDLVDRILAKNPPTKDIDKAIYIARNNSKTTILTNLRKNFLSGVTNF